MSTRDPPARGFTLVEVLAAIVLIAAMSAVCLPIFRDAMRSIERNASGDSIVDLADLADDLVAHPAEYSLSPDELHGGAFERVVSSAGAPVRVASVEVSGTGLVRLTVESGGLIVVRYLPLERRR